METHDALAVQLIIYKYTKANGSSRHRELNGNVVATATPIEDPHTPHGS
jgi:hypothetical protein